MMTPCYRLYLFGQCVLLCVGGVDGGSVCIVMYVCLQVEVVVLVKCVDVCVCVCMCVRVYVCVHGV